MSFDQYHEPPDELPQDTRTFARMIMSLIEEAEAIGWYEQRMVVEKDREAISIMHNAQHEEMKHFGMDLEFLLRRKPKWRETLQGILFKQGNIVEHGDEAEEASESDGGKSSGEKSSGGKSSGGKSSGGKSSGAGQAKRR